MEAAVRLVVAFIRARVVRFVLNKLFLGNGLVRMPPWSIVMLNRGETG